MVQIFEVGKKTTTYISVWIVCIIIPFCNKKKKYSLMRGVVSLEGDR
jgi:abortive infection bacteriophage resistance protein